MDGSTLAFRGMTKAQGSQSLELRFDAALNASNCYTLAMSSSDSSAKAWFELWTRDLRAAAPPDPGEASADRYRELADESLAAESALSDAAAIQRTILERMRDGDTYSTAHKEGGTIISWRGPLLGFLGTGHFLRSDYGESSTVQRFEDNAPFLVFLRQFFDWEARAHCYPDQPPDADAWRLILRLLRPK